MDSTRDEAAHHHRVVIQGDEDIDKINEATDALNSTCAYLCHSLGQCCNECARFLKHCCINCCDHLLKLLQHIWRFVCVGLLRPVCIALWRTIRQVVTVMVIGMVLNPVVLIVEWLYPFAPNGKLTCPLLFVVYARFRGWWHVVERSAQSPIGISHTYGVWCYCNHVAIFPTLVGFGLGSLLLSRDVGWSAESCATKHGVGCQVGISVLLVLVLYVAVTNAFLFMKEFLWRWVPKGVDDWRVAIETDYVLQCLLTIEEAGSVTSAPHVLPLSSPVPVVPHHITSSPPLSSRHAMSSPPISSHHTMSSAPLSSPVLGPYLAVEVATDTQGNTDKTQHTMEHKVSVENGNVIFKDAVLERHSLCGRYSALDVWSRTLEVILSLPARIITLPWLLLQEVTLVKAWRIRAKQSQRIQERIVRADALLAERRGVCLLHVVVLSCVVSASCVCLCASVLHCGSLRMDTTERKTERHEVKDGEP